MLWRHRDFLRLWGAQIASSTGSKVTRTVLPMIAILTVGATPTEMAILSALGVAPGVIAGLIASRFVDRSNKRNLMVRADLFRAVLIFSIPLAAWFGTLSMAQLFAVAALVGAATTIFQIAAVSVLPAIVGADQLVDANAKFEATEAVAESSGPMLGGVLVQILSAPGALVVDALSYLWSAAFLVRIRAGGIAANAEQDSHLTGDIAAGFRANFAEGLWPLFVAETAQVFFGGFFLTLYMIAALEVLGLTPWLTGVIIGVGGIGAFAGAISAQSLSRQFGVQGALIAALILGQATNLLTPLALQDDAWSVPLLIASQLFGDAFMAIYAIHATSLRQRLLPPLVLGRATAALHVALGVSLTAGALVAGPVAANLGIRSALWIAATGGLAAAFIVLAQARTDPKRKR